MAVLSPAEYIELGPILITTDLASGLESCGQNIKEFYYAKG